MRKTIIGIAVLGILVSATVTADIDWDVRRGAAQFGGGDWSGMEMRVNDISLETAQAIAEAFPRVTFFFYVTGSRLVLEGQPAFQSGDAVFFRGRPHLGTTPGVADTYIKPSSASSAGLPSQPVSSGSRRGIAGIAPETSFGSSSGSGTTTTVVASSFGEPVSLGDSNFADEVDGKLVFVDFYADWCGPCRAFAPVYNEVAGIHDSTMFVKVDVDVNPRLSSRYEISAIPYIVAMIDGRVVAEFAGSRTASGFSSWCENQIARARL